MGIYINSPEQFFKYRDLKDSKWFVDKTLLIDEVSRQIGTEQKYICITRPRRFGKTYAANMLAAYYCNVSDKDSHELFDNLNVSKTSDYNKHINKYNVVFIDFSKVDDECTSYEEYIGNIKAILKDDLRALFPDVAYREGSNVIEDFNRGFNELEARFIFVLDEWDAVFHMSFISEDDKKKYLIFLRNLLKDQAYVALSYMTGILPIAKYSSGSEVNMFMEYSMAGGTKFGEYFGFLENEVNDLYQRFVSIEQRPNFTRTELEEWYDGYRTIKGDKIYNPRSITAALTDNHIGSYWTSAGPYDEVSFYVKNNIDEIRNDIAEMISGEKVRSEAKEYAAVSMNLKTRDEILSAMVVYGFLAYEDGYVKIPNMELMKQFENMLYKESDLGYINRLAKESQKMIDATINQNTEVMSKILEYAHDSESPILEYNNEIELSSIVNLVYLSARDQYDIQREDKGGKGFVDFIFYPRLSGKPGIILELKVDETAQYALNQIKDKNYIMRFKGKIAEKSACDEIILVGISYDKKNKKHHCITEKIIL
ncbi:hypothetical protein bpr_I2177 [Butyrivibrio proteoclasticus B316]|uniref:AAA-ATPase-like domain-containing protein n=1 Tax=Butyrivibrio proteoclasticus (strain ATCC 51982 / DSM 14932 / B316) TaxID=515622 RepID=E0RX02_BUTPB|nr:AAA family ATPase [Butyrivibrio proteoclasticus]ADL34910.1 hypothetical protein bpr_I2177 [Butyrivibrio proteoclasticus B316]